MRTWAEWDDAVPGFVEIDLVGHEGGNSRGEFCFTLDVIDIATGWTVTRSVKNEAQKWVFAATNDSTAAFPFPIHGLDSENGSEFINWELFRWCEQEYLTFTRTRSGNKNDGAHVEQKNWHIVRKTVGYHRYDTAPELAKLNEVWEPDRSFTNYLLPQQKLTKKQPYGAKVSKYYDVPATPNQRAVKQSTVWKRPVITMNATLKRLRPVHLQCDILNLTREPEKLSLAQKTSPEKPPVNIKQTKNP
ncbi:hypothetical protein AAGW05_12185 [Arthrobacter sp. LAPM80]|uniref:hypothetical protein n=1 Tax=Arthrobacter sp. LAPM80 TaxID=3141788 RepID=UPI00398B40A3